MLFFHALKNHVFRGVPMTYKRISIILFCADKMYVSARVVPQECSDFMDFMYM